MDSKRHEHDGRSSPPPLQSHLVVSNRLSPRALDQQTLDETSTSTSRSSTTNARPDVTSRYSINTQSKATQLRSRIARTQVQISDTQQKLEQKCKELETKSGNNLPTLQSSPSGESSENGPVSSAKASGGVGLDRHHGHEDTVKKAQMIVRDHIRQLTRYNELKDVGLLLLGMIAEAEGKRVQQVLEERGVKDDAS